MPPSCPPYHISSRAGVLSIQLRHGDRVAGVEHHDGMRIGLLDGLRSARPVRRAGPWSSRRSPRARSCRSGPPPPRPRRHERRHRRPAFSSLARASGVSCAGSSPSIPTPSAYFTFNAAAGPLLDSVQRRDRVLRRDQRTAASAGARHGCVRPDHGDRMDLLLHRAAADEPVFFKSTMPLRRALAAPPPACAGVSTSPTARDADGRRCRSERSRAECGPRCHRAWPR